MAKAVVTNSKNMSGKFVMSVVGRHSFFIFLTFLLLAYIEDSFIIANQAIINLWYIFFEVVSAYANVGLSLSLPGQSFSLCGNFTEASKVLIIFLMLLGKHRMLPRMKDHYIDYDFSAFRRRADRLIERQNMLLAPELTSNEEFGLSVRSRESSSGDELGTILAGRNASYFGAMGVSNSTTDEKEEVAPSDSASASKDDDVLEV
jgi:Cation transport protein